MNQSVAAIIAKPGANEIVSSARPNRTQLRDRRSRRKTRGAWTYSIRMTAERPTLTKRWRVEKPRRPRSTKTKSRVHRVVANPTENSVAFRRARDFRPVEMEQPAFFGNEEWADLEKAFHAMLPCTRAARDPRRFQPLWSPWEFDAACRFVSLPEMADFRLIRAGKPLPSSMYRDRAGTVNVEAVQKLWSAGVSTVLVSIDSYSDRVLEWCRFVEDALRCPVQPNVYATPGESQGLGEHVDRHDVLVLQVRGEKTWDIATSHPLGSGATPVNGRQRVTLRSGSWLYLPKGVPHEVRNHGTEPSVHIAVGFYPLTWSQVVRNAVDSGDLVARPLMDRIPFGRPNVDTAQQIGERLQSLHGWIDIDSSAKAYFAQFPALGQQIRAETTLAQIESITPQTRLAWQTNDVTIESRDGGLQLNRSYRRFPLSFHAAAATIVKTMVERKSFCVADLPSDRPDALLALCRLLANVGFLTIAASTP